ncbi:hypothetical protein KIN20_008270 [Parelaphostrongylus tenuis]|uniref:Uncharacterized protein n=1 Tax=Parelaphostrongylus tenuis TaxID=148309 RepID=A0AAD5MWL5_PARTN|nr:hypothetical protein KIN20_008270 [Parelaphostrongylus tenuis]
MEQRLAPALAIAFMSKVEAPIIDHRQLLQYYLVSCEACRDEYIGGTGGPLYIRVKEYLAGKRNSDPKTSLCTHKE